MTKTSSATATATASAREAEGGGVGCRRRARKALQPSRRFTRRSVQKMLEVMEQSPDANHDPVQDFLSSGRTGRRNAMPDILGEHASTSTAELPARLQQLNTATAGAGGEGTQPAQAPGDGSGAGAGAGLAGAPAGGQPPSS